MPQVYAPPRAIVVSVNAPNLHVGNLSGVADTSALTSWTATVQITAFNSNGSVAGTLTVNLAPDGQYFTENLGAAIGVPAAFVGWLTIQSSAPVLVYNHRITGDGGSTVPVH